MPAHRASVVSQRLTTAGLYTPLYAPVLGKNARLLLTHGGLVVLGEGDSLVADGAGLAAQHAARVADPGSPQRGASQQGDDGG